MPRRALLLLGLLLLGVVTSARAEIPESAVVVSCSASYLVQLDPQTFAVARGRDALTQHSLQALADRKLTLLGAIVPQRISSRVGTRPALFVDLQQPGRAVALLGTDAALALQPFEYAVDRTTPGTQMCTPGAAFPAVQQAVVERPQLSELTYIEYADDQLALSCRPADRADAAVSHLVRALSFAPASSNVQVWDVALDLMTGTIELEQFEDRQSDIRYYPAEKAGPAGTAGSKPAELLVSKATSVDDLGQQRHAARFFDGKRSYQLACEARQAFARNIEKPLAQARELLRPKSLPLPAGTLAQAKREFCADMESFKILQVRYRDLLLKVPGVNLFGIGQLQAAESPLGVHCYSLDIGIRSAAQLSRARAVIGETLEGHLVRYEVGGDVIVQ